VGKWRNEGMRDYWGGVLLILLIYFFLNLCKQNWLINIRDITRLLVNTGKNNIDVSVPKSCGLLWFLWLI